MNTLPRAKERKGKELKTVSHQLGLLINFAEEHLKNGIRRTANNLYDHPFAYLCVPLRDGQTAKARKSTDVL